MDTPLHNFLGPFEYADGYEEDSYFSNNNSNNNNNTYIPYLKKKIIKTNSKIFKPTKMKKQKQNNTIQGHSYRGERNNDRDIHIKSKITIMEFISTPDEWKKIIRKKGLTDSDIIRAKQLRRRELCKGYSKDTRNRLSHKMNNKKLIEKEKHTLINKKLIEENEMLKAENERLTLLLKQYQ